MGARSAVKEITLANEGTAALTISSIALNGGDVGQFVQTNDCGNGIAAGGSCVLSLLFAPDSEGLKRTQVSIGSNAGNPQLIDLEGTGTPAPIVGFDVPSLTFGDVDIGQSADRTVMLTNTGGAALVLSGITVSGDDAAQFSRTTTCLNGASTLAPGARCTVALKFKPGTAGSKSAV
ncbi:choice-of-anchor D domain-containing protein, partial [bacterium]|nr:choice-of-anchor D domain-containing protein [bacterium]